MAHYDCRCCGATYGVSHASCKNCQAGNCGEAKVAEALCEDCPPVGYPTDETRCIPCPRRDNGSRRNGEDPKGLRLKAGRVAACGIAQIPFEIPHTRQSIMTPPVSVIPADREAAAAYLSTGAFPNRTLVRVTREGGEDKRELVQAFASHRIASQEDLVEALKEAETTLAILVDVAEDISLPGAPVLNERLESIRAALSRVKGDGE